VVKKEGKVDVGRRVLMGEIWMEGRVNGLRELRGTRA
jgi:hypothetical protein